MVGFVAATLEAGAEIGVIVPDLKINEELHEAHAAFDEAAGDEAAAAIAVGGLAADAVHDLRGLGFAGEVERVASLELHARGEFVTGHAGAKAGLPRAAALVGGVELGDEIALKGLHGLGLIEGGLKVEHRGTGGAEAGALMLWRQETGLPVLRAVDGQLAGVLQHDVSGQVSVFRAEPVAHPRAEGWQTRLHAAAVRDEQRRLVREVGGVHRADEGDVVDALGEVGHHVGNRHAALAVLREGVRAAHHRAGVLRVLHFTGDFVEVRLAVEPVQLRLGVEQVHLARPAVHEQMND